ncbi:hypothetical protein [Clostridium beijerinckii]|uniref:DUF7922 domain-containing protein n=1 Tax=Clostridium beijerinckii TaxID=1520 RepID=A0A0B5Q3L4_CLOBE|nr:hypothetical protein [Clostridium beijerinckii]AJG96754.1 hypothetical protein LF65_00062 [Clostridium beijerinckii]AQS02711.1 hypothetical protein CLBIJ_00700 [Clostridium beijerinckii]MBA2887747.1 hypothetical protein [Clostridium beijerinckii]MBA2902545.1 hypothetical protein [Clostridium beijerinckii]MBA2912333.1 hypothetical protein [Clostridium beijerinckii]
MAHNKLYRNFIILQEDERGYSQSNDKALSGYAKVEAKGDKCKISFYAQNLRQEDNYSMVLICCKKDLKQLIDIGPLAINEVGKGDTSKEYYVNNIASLGISYEKISGAAICRVKDNETEFVMHGFMNGEESADNWRKFKIIKADSRKYVDKTTLQTKEKENLTVSTLNKTITQSGTKEDELVKAPKLQDESVERKKDDIDLQPKANIESKVEDKQNRIPEDHQNITETIDNLDEERNKNKESKKCEKDYKHDKCDKHDKEDKYDKCDKHDKCDKEDKYDKHDKYDKYDKYDKWDKDEKYNKCDKYDKHDKYDYFEKEEDIDDVIGKIANKLDTYDGVIDLKVSHHMYEEVIVYGFIKDKKNHNSKWKKFKLEKKCRNENQDIDNVQVSSRRIEENFKLDKLNDVDTSDRMDIIDFDEYENNIQQGNLGGATGANDTSTMNTTGTGESMEQGNSNTGMGQINTGTMWQPWSGNSVSQTGTGAMNQTGSNTGTDQTSSNTGMNQMNTGTMEQPETSGETGGMGQLDLNMGDTSNENNNNQNTSNQGFTISGDIGKYFEKLAQDFKPFIGKLNDINFCKWYKIIVNGIEDLSNDTNYNKYTLAYYPMLNYYPYISKKGHFLLGYKCNKDGEMQYIIYAIPGSKEKNDQPYGGRTGFVTWTNDSNNGQGYWLMFYDFKNSSIVIPAR